MKGVVGAVELDDVLFSVGEWRWKGLPRAHLWQRPLGPPTGEGRDDARWCRASADCACMLGTVGFDSGEGLGVSLGGMAI